MINGSYLRQLRKSRRFTLVQLSREIGCTASFLSQIERGQKEPSLTTLRKLSEVMNVSMSSFFQPEVGDETHFSSESQPRYSVVRRENRAALPVLQHIARCEVLTPSMDAKQGNPLQGVIAFMQPGTFCSEKIIVHPERDEFLYVVCGSVTAYVDGDEILLRTGDSIYVNAGTGHNFFNGGSEECLLLAASN